MTDSKLEPTVNLPMVELRNRHVDSPDSPTTRKTATSAESLPAVSGFSHVLTTILAIVKTLICTIFSIDATQAINRTAVFLSE